MRDRRLDRIEIAIDGDGRGMPKGLVERVFEPFDATRVQAGGTGLGLAFHHGVIVDHGGQIHVESKLGKGTQVRLLFPMASRGHRRRHERPHSRRPGDPASSGYPRPRVFGSPVGQSVDGRDAILRGARDEACAVSHAPRTRGVDVRNGRAE